jgi:predicted dehydrogenase
MPGKKRYAVVGLGGRSSMYYEAVAGQYKRSCCLVGFCDLNQTRMDYANHVINNEYGAKKVTTYKAHEFDKMIKEQKPDTVIVTTMDRTHHRYITGAMELGCDVISEKPMTTDAEKCQAILDTQKRTGRSLTVTFNYRYAPHNTKVREVIMKGTIGEIFSVHFEWLLDTYHGADYYRRWHRDKRNSGGLLVHKATHHFDLVNFWLGSKPESVFAMGDLRFYGRENAENRGVRRFYSRAYGSEAAKKDPFALHLESKPALKAMYLDAEKEDGYYRDQSVFGDGISIEDVMGVLVKYRNKAIMTYSLNSYMPWEGYRVGFNGSRGRIEVQIMEASYVNAGGKRSKEGAAKTKSIIVFPHFKAPYEVKIPKAKGSHGGGDQPLVDQVFGRPKKDPFNRAASHIDGAYSILTGIAANTSLRTEQPVKIKDLIRF